MARLTKSLFVLLLLTGMAATPVGCDQTMSAESGTFLTARSLVVAGRYSEALPKLTEYLRLHPDGKHASRAGLFLGKAYVGLRQHEKARAAWELTVKDYGTTLEGHKCRYKLAWLSMIEGDYETAIKGFSELAGKPSGPLAPESAAMCRFLKGLQEVPQEHGPADRDE